MMINLEVALIQELHLQCDGALDAFEQAYLRLESAQFFSKQLQLLFEKTGKLDYELQNKCQFENKNVFREIHSFIMCHSAINRFMFFGKAEKKDLHKRSEFSNDETDKIKKIHKCLIDKISIQDMPTFQERDRNLRDYLEHYDRQLYEFYARNANGSGLRICAKAELGKLATATTQNDYLRVFTPDTKEFFVKGEAYFLGYMYDDVVYLKNKLNDISISMWGSSLFS